MPRRRWCAFTRSASRATFSARCAAIAGCNWSWRSSRSQRQGAGILLYEQQEGRGIGLMAKLKAYELQDQGLDTVEANEELGFAADCRAYELPAEVLKLLGVSQVRLITNNPEKVAALESAGIEVTERVSAEVEPQASFAAYLKTKQEKMGHIFDGVNAIDDLG